MKLVEVLRTLEPYESVRFKTNQAFDAVEIETFVQRPIGTDSGYQHLSFVTQEILSSEELGADAALADAVESSLRTIRHRLKEIESGKKETTKKEGPREGQRQCL